MPYRKIPLAIFLPLLLPACAPSPQGSDAPVPAAMIRPPCAPPAALMQPPQKLAALPAALSEAAAIQAWLDDMQAYQHLRGQTGALQSFVWKNCQ